MSIHKDKTKGNNRQSISTSLSKEQSVYNNTLQFVDNRQEGSNQKKTSEMISSSIKSKQAAHLQSTIHHSPVLQKKINKTGLPDELKTGIENLSGYSMDDVKVHYNSASPAQLQAKAYAQGTNIHLAPGQEKHLPHETWHVVQQKQGRVKPTLQMKKGVNINDDKGLEKEADVMGAKAMWSQNITTVKNTTAVGTSSSEKDTPIQRTMLMSSEATTVAPITRANLLKWLMKTSSPKVKALLNSPHVTFRIRFDNTIGGDGSTNIRLQYTDKNAVRQGSLDLLDAASIATINSLEYPLQDYTFFITTSVKTGGRLQGSPPAAANAVTTWQGILVHEIEAHTGLATKAMENLNKMETLAKASIPSLKEKITGSMSIRTDDAEHKNLAAGNAVLAQAQENTVLKAATHNDQVNILIDIVTDRVKHIDWFITNASDKKLALRSAKSFLTKTANKISDLTVNDNTRINALKGWIDAKIV
ncbi:DUF4157 domain-containing protein [Aquimarina sp. RZ0]|uniref:eCIS core domain-containing protein n=1 Tax=Aquimarina sp. RZ0 TaxID=2607730 RepID=UPI001CB6ECF2|nr:DUF4157 domain-containing protein [Aquimarina sp. RZ0]